EPESKVAREGHFTGGGAHPLNGERQRPGAAVAFALDDDQRICREPDRLHGRIERERGCRKRRVRRYSVRVLIAGGILPYPMRSAVDNRQKIAEVRRDGPTVVSRDISIVPHRAERNRGDTLGQTGIGQRAERVRKYIVRDRRQECRRRWVAD